MRYKVSTVTLSEVPSTEVSGTLPTIYPYQMSL